MHRIGCFESWKVRGKLLKSFLLFFGLVWFVVFVCFLYRTLKQGREVHLYPAKFNLNA